MTRAIPCPRRPRARTLPASLAKQSRMRRRVPSPQGDQRGGAVSLMVILMVPVSAFAAVVATAVPQRMAAESSLEEATADIAALAVAWRDAQGRDDAPLDAFFGDCAASVEPDPDDNADKNAGPDGGFAARLSGFCDAVSAAVLRDLGGHGFDPATIRGFYSGAYATADDLPEGWGLPCSTGNRTSVADAVHAGMVARWDGPGWAAAQAFPRGVPMGAEAVGVLVLARSGNETWPRCGALLSLVPDRLAPHGHNNRDARRLAESVPTRVPFAG